MDEEEVEPRTIVEGIVELLSPRAHAKGIELIGVLEPDVPAAVLADGIRLRQILTNLVGNALKFTEKGGVWIDVRAFEGRDRRILRFDVRDTGVGVPPEKRQEIFKEFVQADSTHARRFGGSGLGLAISKRLVAAMGGDIGIEPAPGGGSIFWFTLPVIATREGQDVEGHSLAGFRVAIVTRNAVLREAIGAQIRAAGGELVALAAPGAPDGGVTAAMDAVLIDAGTQNEADLPSSPYPNIRSIVLVTPGARGKLAELRAMGFASYLVKPVRQASLAARLRAVPDEAAERAMSGEFDAPVMVDRAVTSLPLENARALKILLAEDNPVNALLTRELLRRRGHTVREVVSGEAAIAALTDEEFDLVITDIHMPGLDGIEATRRIRRDEFKNSRRHTPIVALTADALETGRLACQDAGMDGFLTKPIDPAELDAMFTRLFPSDDRVRDAAA